MKKEIYICDICKKEFTEGNLNKVVLPHKHIEPAPFPANVGWDKELQYSTIEICDECAKKLDKLISDNFVFIYSIGDEKDLNVYLTDNTTKEKE